jgi:hypothetical protein
MLCDQTLSMIFCLPIKSSSYPNDLHKTLDLNELDNAFADCRVEHVDDWTNYTPEILSASH